MGWWWGSPRSTFSIRVGPVPTPRRKIYSALVLQQNGAIQGNGSDPDMYWPRALGPISDADMMGVDANRTSSELAGTRASSIFLRGLNFKTPATTAAAPSPPAPAPPSAAATPGSCR